MAPNSAANSKALLGLAWGYIKLKQYQNVVPPLEILLKKYPHSEYIPEVYLLLGQAHLKLHLYDKSIYYFNKIVERFPKSKKNELIIRRIAENIDREQKQIKNIQINLLMIETRLLNSIQLTGSKKYVPKFMLNEKNKLEKRRRILLRQIVSEREDYQNLLTQIQQLKLVYERRNKDWRSYAEYGISRALYLKEQEH
ncbi:tol-pal system protein YbgF [bacterium BMS3Abin05]|nr:tol-pal system protein YbgF [bacterium BMS3Abin05]GBE27187.1 tol-pal system protein YbgF [bacterium BMS3Bbin03]HDK35910.1 tetratricopeptide repeat protein [Bacteroidota bacterium]